MKIQLKLRFWFFGKCGYWESQILKVCWEELEFLPLPIESSIEEKEDVISLSIINKIYVLDYPFWLMNSDLKQEIHIGNSSLKVWNLLKTQNLYFYKGNIFSSFRTTRFDVEEYLTQNKIVYSQLQVTNNKDYCYWSLVI